MPNPIFIIVLVIVIYLSLVSFFDYFRGLKSFFSYLMVAGFLKRLMSAFGQPSGLEYSLFVGFSLVLFSSVLLGFIFRRPAPDNPLLSPRHRTVWILYFTLLLLLAIGLFRSPFPLTGSVATFVVAFSWMIAFPMGFELKRKQVIEVIRLFVITAVPISLYGLFQFFHGPFWFEMSSVDQFSAVSDWETGSFRRGTPTYDSFEPQAVHLVTAFLFAGWRPLRLPKWGGTLLRILILMALVVSGNRGGLLLLTFAFILYLVYRLRVDMTQLKSSLAMAFLVVCIGTLNLLYVPFQDFADEVGPVLGAGSGDDFRERLGAVYTMSARMVGRQNAIEHASLFGVGTGYNYAAGTIRNKPGFTESEWYLPGSAEGGLWSHDLIGEMLIDLGLLGVAVFLILCLTYIRRTASKAPSDDEDAKLLAGLSAIFLSAFATAAILGGSYFWNRQGAFLWMMAGFCLSLVTNKSSSQHFSAYRRP